MQGDSKHSGRAPTKVPIPSKLGFGWGYRAAKAKTAVRKRCVEECDATEMAPNGVFRNDFLSQLERTPH
jgi:hypothetical protein